VEDLFNASLYCELVNSAMELTGTLALTPEKIESANRSTVRVVKQVEIYCQTLPLETPNFCHYVPSEWLMRNPSFLDGATEQINQTLDNFEKVFQAINGFLGN
jgi:hypothetical protein